MKLYTGRSKFLSFILLLFSLTALAYGVFTLSSRDEFSFSASSPLGLTPPDSLAKAKPQQADTAFGNGLRRAEVLIKANKLEEGLAELEKAQKLKPTDKVVNARIAQVKGMIADNLKKQDDFRASVASGDASFQKKDYLNAKAYYQVALNILPADSSAKEKLRKTMELLRSQKAQNTLFDVAVANADRLFQAGDYERAKTEYENASRILPSEQYPKQKINEIIKIQVDNQLQDGAYAEAIKTADKYYAAKNWQPALLEYQNATRIRPQEKYPKDRIAELTTLVAAQRNKDEAYIKLISSADQSFAAKAYPSARKDYVSALKIKPDQSYPKNKISEIDGLLAKLGKSQKEYENYISLADSFYIDKNFLQSRDYYTLALGVKPGEPYPTEMLEKLKPLCAGQEASEKSRQEAYLSAIAIADREFAAKNYQPARNEYQRASGIKPAETYPKERIEAIDKIIAGQQQAAANATLAEKAKQEALDKQYTAAISAGDKLFGTKSYAEAKVKYLAAQNLKPGETYPPERIAEINKLLEEAGKQKVLDGEYAAIIASGEKLFKAKSWEPAKAEYQKALGLKPDEGLPKRRIASIDSISLAMDAKLKKLEDDYLAAVKNGDSLLTSNEYAKAKTAFTHAAALKPGEEYPKQRLAVINAALADLSKQQALDKQYGTLVAGADKLLAAKSYPEAKSQYKAALGLKPGEAYPAARIAEIDKTVADIAKQKTIDSEYNTVLASAEALFKAKSYDQARPGYEKALQIKPEEILPQRKIAMIDSINGAEFAKLKKLEDDYLAAVKNGDSLLSANEYAKAKTVFTRAAGMKPGEEYPKQRLAIINAALADLAKQQALDKQYGTVIAGADKLLAAKSYPEAKAQYKAALALKPGEAYPAAKISEIDKTIEDIAKQKALDTEYNSVLASAESLFKAKSFDQARPGYEKALQLKPEEILPRRKIAMIDSINAAEIARVQKLDADYSAAVKKGDSLLGANQYALAKTAFTQASALKPAETYPKEKLSVINTALADLAKQQALDKQYGTIIAGADKLLAAKSYPEAKAQYTAALALKPGEAYPKAKVAEIEKTLADIAKQKALDDEYNSVLASGEALFKAKSYEQAKAEYQKALVLKAEETLPKRRITSIDSIAEVILRLKSLEEQYAATIKSADKLFASKTWEQAKAEYQKALSLKPDEAYPKTKIQEADRELAEIARLAKLDQDYGLAVKKGDSLFGLRSYALSKTAFTEASALKPAETYPRTKIAQIDKAMDDLARQQELDRQYQSAVAEADKYLAARSLGGAKAKYTSALSLKPAEAYPKTKIAEIDKIVSDSIQKQKDLDAQYAGLIRSADQALTAKSYLPAKSDYEKASALKPSEEYPKTRLSEISKALADIAARKSRDSAYAVIIGNADKLLAARSFEEAKAQYQKALLVKADDIYAKTKISEIDKAVADVARQKAMVENNYKAAITKGDQLLASKSYDLAKGEYNRALGIKAGEQYPQDKIKEIDNILAELKAKDEAYKASVAKADQMLLEKKYDEARTEYENALTIKINDQYAKNKVDEINKKLIEIQGRKKTFDDMVLKGDNAFGSKDYGKAKEYFQQAVALFPEEKYAKERFDRVSSVIDSIYRANKGKYDKVIAEADKFYNGFEFDKAIDAYTEASSLLPMENYPKEMIARIHRTLAENAIADVLNSPVTIVSNDEKQFKFTPVNVASRKDNFIYVKLRNLSGKPFNVLLRYGKDKQPSGGIVIRNLSVDGKVNERLISVREQDVWYRVDNDYISLYPQGGDIEVTFIQVSKAR